MPQSTSRTPAADHPVNGIPVPDISAPDTCADDSPAALAAALERLHQNAHGGAALAADSNRLAFADPQFLFCRETRGIRMQLELLKPDLAQSGCGVENTVVVYGSARFVSPEAAEQQLRAAQDSADPECIRLARRAVRNARRYAQARAFARLVARDNLHLPAQERLTICTGGGPGIMEAANAGAHDAGAPSIGLNIELPHEQGCNRFVTPGLGFKFHYFALRKMHFVMRAKALVAFPGGFGTLDELFEVLTLVQTGKTRAVPVILFDTGFWRQFLNFDLLVQEGTISAQDLDLFRCTDDPAEAWALIRQFHAPGGWGAA